jgi:hypothetical protein
VTAAGTGCAAALDAERYLAALEDEHVSGSRQDAAKDAATNAPLGAEALARA